VLAAVVLAAVLVTQGGGGSDGPRDRSTAVVPASIPADCSRAVEGDLMRFLSTVPDGMKVQFPKAGCYGQDRTIVVTDRKNLVIDGGGSTFKRITPPNPTNPAGENTNNANWRILRSDTVTLRNMTIRGNYEPPPRGTPGQGQYTDHGISVWGGLNHTIVDVAVSNTDGELVGVDADVETAGRLFGGDYAKAEPSRNIVIDRLRGEHASRQCVATTAVDGFTMRDSTIVDCQQTGFDAEVDLQGVVNRNIKILNNTFSGVYFAAIQVPVLSLPGFEGTVGEVEIRGNTMTQAGDTCLPAIYIGDKRGGITGLTITDNTLLTLGDGIQFNGEPASAIQGSVSNNTIRRPVDNNVCDNPNFMPPYSTPIRLNGSPVTVSGNRFENFCCNQNLP